MYEDRLCVRKIVYEDFAMYRCATFCMKTVSACGGQLLMKTGSPKVGKTLYKDITGKRDEDITAK